MNTAFRSARALLALALILLSPGLEPYAAAISVGARVSPAASGAPAAAVSHPGPVALPSSVLPNAAALSAGSLNAGLALPSAALPSAAVPSAAAATPAFPGAQTPSHSAPNVAAPASPGSASAALANTPAHSTWNVPVQAGAPRSAADPAAAAPTAAPTAAARSQLSAAARRIVVAAVPSASVELGKSALDAVFSGSAKLGVTDAAGGVSAGSQRSLGAVLGKSGGDAGQPPRAEEPRSPEAPRQSLGRSARVGLVAAIVPIAITFGAMIAAQALGYHFHAGYQSPVPEHLTAVTALTTAAAAAVMAPVSEEMIFRGGLMGWLTKRMPASFGATLRFAVPAVMSSLVFVAVHELSDPVLFATRFVHSMILSYAFHKEGYTGSMFAHGFFNGLLVLPVVFSVLIPGAAPIATIALFPLSLWLGWKALKRIRAERPDKKSGRLVAYQISPLGALLLAALLALGYAFIMPNIVWPIGAIGWLGYALRRMKAGRR